VKSVASPIFCLIVYICPKSHFYHLCSFVCCPFAHVSLPYVTVNLISALYIYIILPKCQNISPFGCIKFHKFLNACTFSIGLLSNTISHLSNYICLKAVILISWIEILTSVCSINLWKERFLFISSVPTNNISYIVVVHFIFNGLR
jgi:hypothetical protein